MEPVETTVALATTAKEGTHDDHYRFEDIADDPLSKARSAITGEDRAYTSAHPELSGLVSYFLANGEGESERVVRGKKASCIRSCWPRWHGCAVVVTTL